MTSFLGDCREDTNHEQRFFSNSSLAPQGLCPGLSNLHTKWVNFFPKGLLKDKITIPATHHFNKKRII